LDRTGGDKEFLDELLEMYLEDFEDKFPQIKEALAAKDNELIRELAHSLKGSSANLSLLNLQDTFYRLEMAGRENRMEEAGNLLPCLQQEFERLRSYLQKEVANDPQPQEVSGNDHSEIPKAGEKNTSPHTEKILLADDSTDNLLIFQKYLAGTELGLDTAGDGEKALDLFLKHTYSLVFLDLHMPLLNGQETLAKIRQFEKENDISPTPVICLSAASAQEERGNCLSLGFNGYLEKPVDKTTIIETIQRFKGNGKEDYNTDVISIDESILDLIPSYIANRKKDIHTMRSALDCHEFETIETLAHKMKGSGTSYGFIKISELGKNLELLAQQQDKDSIRIEIDELEAYLEGIRYG
jgi:HPt (histidine-containing phosphotransfer) domain-containing protein